MTGVEHLVVVRTERDEVGPVVVETVFVYVVYFYNVIKPTQDAFLLMLVEARCSVCGLFPVWVVGA